MLTLTSTGPDKLISRYLSSESPTNLEIIKNIKEASVKDNTLDIGTLGFVCLIFRKEILVLVKYSLSGLLILALLTRKLLTLQKC